MLDRTSLSYGDAVQHTDDTTTISITQTGLYTLAFNGAFAPANGVTFPMNLITVAELNGTTLQGGSTQFTFHTSTETVDQTFMLPFTVTTVPSTLEIVSTATEFLYSNITATVYRHGAIPETGQTPT